MTQDANKSPVESGVEVTDSPKPASAPAIDWEALNAKWKAEREKAREKLNAERAGLLAALREKGVEEIEACYDGYADSGNVQGIEVTPDSVKLGDLEARLADFVWEIAYNLHPGFENNDGGEGVLTWNVVEDRIDVEHADLYKARKDYRHEDI